MKHVGLITVLGILIAGGAVRPSGAAAHVATARAEQTWAQATAFPRPAFAVQRRIDVGTAAGFWRAWDRLRPGDLIVVHGVAFHGEAVFSKKLSNWAEVHFGPKTTFTGQAGSNVPAVWIHDASHIRFFGAHLTNPTGGAGLTIYDSSYITWWNFVIDRTANTGLFVQGIKTAVSNLDLKGVIAHWGLKLSLDPHTDKGTGLHGANLADSNYGVKNSRFALTLHDGATGSGVQAGGARSTDGFWNNTLYLRCVNLTMVAKTQTGGNCVQVWGVNVLANDFAFIRANTLQGRPYDAGGMSEGQSLATDSVTYGRAVSTNLNPAIGPVVWDSHDSTSFVDVAPAP